ncbi:MAG: hypothetical protein ACTS8R_03575 [Arsenophonus sp. NC-QC1-MAG3]
MYNFAPNQEKANRLYLLLIIGITIYRRKELVAPEDAYRDSEAN